MTWITWISKLSKTKKRWENHRKYLPNRWNGARKTNNHVVLGDLLEDGLLLSDVSAMSQRCLSDVSRRLPAGEVFARCLWRAGTGSKPQMKLNWIHRVFIMISSRWTFHHFHLIRISWWILDESHDSSWLLRFFLIRTTISVWKKRGESAGYINQLRLLYQGVRWVWPFRSEVKQGFEPSFTSFLRHARRILKLKDMKGVNHCKLLEE